MKGQYYCVLLLLFLTNNWHYSDYKNQDGGLWLLIKITDDGKGIASDITKNTVLGNSPLMDTPFVIIFQR